MADAPVLYFDVVSLVAREKGVAKLTLAVASHVQVDDKRMNRVLPVVELRFPDAILPTLIAALQKIDLARKPAASAAKN